ncbi:Hypothetical predicted protein [Pelobates cultripes]|uniref:Uncharacterized protein n=1 Tax=Pelobates cultripes TaxID=61616 RepID=A0AAD1TBY6_PELCU|nr:Hypothetical predicted protein [Pelobates cultripes]
MSSALYRSLLSLTVSLMSLVCVFANGPEEETLDIKYAVIGACFGAVFGVIFIVLKLCLLKTKILDSFSDSESFNLRTIRQGNGENP